MPKVYNITDSDIPAGAVMVDRKTQWGNPFKLGMHGDRDMICAKFELWFLGKPELIVRAKQELRGKDLVCYCKPLRCHADVLLRVANEP